MSKSLLSLRAKGRQGGNIFATATAMANKVGAVNLGQGFPSFPTPNFVKECASNSIMANFNQYTRPGGHIPLMEILSKIYETEFNRSIDPLKNIASCNGAQEGIFNTFATFLDPQDEVLTIEPYFDAYRKAAEMCQVVTKGVPLRLSENLNGCIPNANDFILDMDELESSITDKTKMLILNTPHNPTGKVFSLNELKKIAKVVEKFPNLLVLSDEVYEFMTFEGLKHERFANIENMWDRTISLFSAGKTFSTTGWRVGYCIGPEKLIDPLIQTQGIISFCTPTPLQEGVGQAFIKGKSLGYFKSLANKLQINRDVLCESLTEAGLQPIIPKGGYFVMADTSNIPVSLNNDEPRDVNVNKWLAEHVGICGIPTSYFYSEKNRHLSDNVIRLAYCKTDAELEDASTRLKNAFN